MSRTLGTHQDFLVFPQPVVTVNGNFQRLRINKNKATKGSGI